METLRQDLGQERVIIQGTHILLESFENDAVTNFVNLPRLLREWIMRYYYRTIVQSSELVTREYEDNLTGICAYEKREEIKNPKTQLSLGERVVNTSMDLFINRVTKGRYRLAGSFFEFMETLEETEMPGDHLYISQMSVEKNSQGSGIGKDMVKEVVSLGEKNKLGVWLYTVDERNIKFYEGCGFTMVSSGIHDKTGLKYWTFKKEFHDPQGDTQSKVREILAGN